MYSADRAAVRAALLALLDSLPSATISVAHNGSVQTFTLPAEANGHAPDTDCAEDILYVLGEAIEPRLTTAQVMDALAKYKFLHGDTTVKTTLARLVKQGRIRNRADMVPRGYELATNHGPE